MALLALDQVTFTYPGASSPALDGVSLVCAPGSYTIVAGLSGCGKTTLLRALKTPLAPAGRWTGAVLCDGVPLKEIPLRDQARRIGFVMQEPDAQIVCDSVEAELAFGLENVGAPRDLIGLKVAETASFFGIQPWLHRKTASLSGGQKQLLNLAAVLALAPEVLVLDEPTSQLDPLAADEFLAAVRRVNHELGVTVIMAEHRLEGVLADADQLVVLQDGRVAAVGEPRAVAAQLCAAKSPMAAALPAAVRVWAAVESAGTPADVAASLPPLTVREGRAWLEAREQRRASSEGARVPCTEGVPKANGPAALRLRDAWFRYGREMPDVLRGFSLEVRAGSVTALIGANGAGKSTALKAACALARPYRGSVEVLGHTLRSRRLSASDLHGVALLPQDPTLLFSRQTVREELEDMRGSEGGAPVAAPASPSFRPGALAPDGLDGCPSVDEIAKLCAIEPLMDAHPLDLSGGERQRVALAKVLVTRPQLLLLDEPEKGADAAFRSELGALLRQLAARGSTVLFASHDLDFCAQWADEAALVFDGVVAASAPPRVLFAQADFYTTAASRMSRGLIAGAVTVEEIVEACCQEGA